MALKRLIAVLLLVWPSCAHAQVTPAFASWFDGFAQQAAAQGIRPDTLERALPLFQLDESVIELDRAQPEKKATFATYLKNTLPQARFDRAREALADHQETLVAVERNTGVPPEVVVALWGMESGFGSNMGDDDVITSLATLAFEGRRSAFFTKELIEALLIVQDEGRDPASLKGSWAGAMGQCQFMPSTYRRFAVDFNGDGVRDIWEDEKDVFASIATYLAAEGWRAGSGWGQEVMAIRPVEASKVGLDTQLKLKEWGRYGIRGLDGKPLPDQDIMASFIQPDGVGGRSFLVFDNYRALMRWNRSTYFATAIGLFSSQLSDRR